MSKKSFRSTHATEEPSASYPTWAEASSRRSFLAIMGKAAAGGILASLTMAACGDNRSVKDPDGGPQQNYSDGVPPQPDVQQPVWADSGAAPQPDVPWTKPADVGPPGPDLLSGVPDQAPAPPDMWPQFSDGLPSQPDVYWPPPANDAGGPPMPPAPKDEK